MDEGHEKDEENQVDPLLTALQVDDSLEDRLKDHGMSKRNIRSMILEVFSNENVMKLLSAQDDDPELDFPDFPVTRSKRLKGGHTLEDYCDGTVMSDMQINESFVTSDLMEENQNWLNDADEDTLEEFDWQKWLNEEIPNLNESQGDEDSENDPDFNFLAEFDDFDEEDYRNDHATKVTKKELSILTKDAKVKRNVFREKTNCMVVNPGVNSDVVSEKPHEDFKSAMDNFNKCKTIREKLQMIRMNPTLYKTQKLKQNNEANRKHDLFSVVQKHQLKQQMQQHLQLLVQTCILDSKRSENFMQSVQYLNELCYFQSESPIPEQTLFNVNYLLEAKQIIEIFQSKTSPKSLASTRQQVDFISHSPVFLYPELIPKSEEDRNKSDFSVNEDCLIVYGLSEMSGYFLSAPELISTYLLPVHTPTEIASRIRTVRQCKSHIHVNNPINQYKMFGILPPYCKKVPDVNFEDVKKPIKVERKFTEWIQKINDSLNNINRNYKVNNDMTSTRKLKTSAKNIKKSPKGKVKTVWTREMDEKVLSICKLHGGLTCEALLELSKEFLFLSRSEIKSRFYELMDIYSSKMRIKSKTQKQP